MFKERAAMRSEHPALMLKGETLSYGELLSRVTALTNVLKAQGVGAGDLVALYVETSLEMIVGYLAILAAGGMVVPLEYRSAPGRCRLILEDAGAKVVVTRNHLQDELPLDGLRCIDVETSGEQSAGDHVVPSISQPALMVYTSGSSGVPKGVVLTHANLAHYVAALEGLFEITHQDVFLLRGSVALIVFARQLLVPLCLGATVVMATPEERQDPLALLSLVKRSGVTIFDHVPSFWKGLTVALSSFTEEEKASLFDVKVRLVATGGERVNRELVEPWFSWFLEGTRFFGMYGQTEGNGVVTGFPITRETLASYATVPLGSPVNGMGLLVLNEQGDPVVPGGQGEICIFGKGVAQGYWKRPNLTSECFREMELDSHGSIRLYRTGDIGCVREDGAVEFVGRVDEQVKIRGHRVELGEVEHALLHHPKIDQAAVIVGESGSGDPQLIAYFLSERPVDPHDLILELQERLTPNMVPARIAHLPNFPIAGNGKIDRQALRTPYYTQQAFVYRTTNFVEPINDLEGTLLQVWQLVLESNKVGVEDDFFILGGDSIKAITLVTEIERALGFRIPLDRLQQFSTVRQLAAELQIHEPCLQTKERSLKDADYRTLLQILLGSQLPLRKPGSLLLLANEGGSRPPLFWCFNGPQKEMSALVRLLPDDQPVYGMISSVPLENTQENLERVARQYVDELLEMFPQGPFRLGGNCRGAKVICEMVMLLEARSIPMEKICLLEFFHPHLYGFKGELYLLFGRYSHLKRHELVKYDQPGWDAPFARPPAAAWLPCGHGEYFDQGNVQVLGECLNSWLAG
jgi:amino acid adenylation domain-containing protein